MQNFISSFNVATSESGGSYRHILRLNEAFEKSIAPIWPALFPGRNTMMMPPYLPHSIYIPIRYQHWTFLPSPPSQILSIGCIIHIYPDSLCRGHYIFVHRHDIQYLFNTHWIHLHSWSLTPDPHLWGFRSGGRYWPRAGYIIERGSFRSSFDPSPNENTTAYTLSEIPIILVPIPSRIPRPARI